MNRWYALCDKFAVLTEREKWLIAISGWVALIFAGYLLVVEPVLMKQESLQRQRASISNVLTASMEQIQVIERKLRTDPDQEIDEKIARLTR
ncbi:type II secretion system protein GspM, partial [Vibrio natriegens]